MKLKVNAPLDPGFMPMSIVYRDFEAAVAAEGAAEAGAEAAAEATETVSE